MSLFDTIKTDAQKNVEGLLGDIFNYQTEKLLNAPTLVRLKGQAPAGNLTAEQIKQGMRGETAPIPQGNSNGDLSNSITSPWLSNKMMYIVGAVILVVVVLVPRRK